MSPKETEEQLNKHIHIIKKRGPVFLFLVTGLSVFLTEFIIMNILYRVLPTELRTSEWFSTIDSLILSPIVFIILYLSVFQPLHNAYKKIRILKGLLPVCSCCKAINDGHGEWYPIETYIRDNSEAHFTHGVCPQCLTKLKEEYGLVEKTKE